jgi:hypothetical protein
MKAQNNLFEGSTLSITDKQKDTGKDVMRKENKNGK